MSILPTNEKYIMFLNPIYFKKSFFKSLYNKVIKHLESKGIVVFNIMRAINDIKIRYKYNNTLLATYDNNIFPTTNTLYIHLVGRQYFNDSIYNKKKIELERDMLFLLAGKLGVKKINYETEIIETTISGIDGSAKLKGLTIASKFDKNILKKEGSKGSEEYLNNGSPIYLKSINLQEVEKNIEEKMGKLNIFNYDFYKKNSKLESFVYKRYEFKMQKLEYFIETEDISDISFTVKSCFMNNGIDISFNKITNYSENIHYTLEFFTDLELKTEFGISSRSYFDNFYNTRELYELIDDKDKSVYIIVEYVLEFSKNYKYKNKITGNTYNFYKHINNYIKNSEPGTFESQCHHFNSTYQIKNWINKTFLTNDMEIIDEADIDETSKTKLDTLKSKNIKNIKHIKTIDKTDNNLNKLLETLKYISENDEVDKNNVSEESTENDIDPSKFTNELGNLIQKCKVNKLELSDINKPVSIINWEMDESDNINKHTIERPPIIPIPTPESISIHSEEHTSASFILPDPPIERESDI